MARDDEVMVQDVNPLNAGIYLDGYMYVGGQKHIPRPSFFAPYFTEECQARVPEIGEAGIACYSEVFAVHEIDHADLLRNPVGFAPDSQIRAHQYWNRWQRGLRAIAKRAREEPFQPEVHLLYFLLEPIQLTGIVKKRGWLSQIPWGFGTTLDRLKRARLLRDLKP